MIKSIAGDLNCYVTAFRPGRDNMVAGTFSRVYYLAFNTNTLYQLHNSLRHPGIMRILAFIRSRNLPIFNQTEKTAVSIKSVILEIQIEILFLNIAGTKILMALFLVTFMLY